MLLKCSHPKSIRLQIINSRLSPKSQKPSLKRKHKNNLQTIRLVCRMNHPLSQVGLMMRNYQSSNLRLLRGCISKSSRSMTNVKSLGTTLLSLISYCNGKLAIANRCKIQHSSQYTKNQQSSSQMPGSYCSRSISGSTEAKFRN